MKINNPNPKISSEDIFLQYVTGKFDIVEGTRLLREFGWNGDGSINIVFNKLDSFQRFRFKQKLDILINESK